ncbi:hypothetical protein [Micromonospora carbonacea]|uniref:Uncharacterized protein n=1 Tax=Micromonospora carbonacea TaxID=47853 RepID=A0A1C5A302_9ACTN|nr:hypothetical protein [Micromonospora carbonacea]SCF39580.1 hypothetical protein GA0070563_11139 [Micromonospora carbonacea]
MTRAPANLLAVRSLLLDHLDIDESRTRAEDLEPAEVGIVGDASHRGGYHCGSDRVVSGDYSVVESPRDSSGLTLDSSALDVGGFSVKSGGSTHDLRSFSVWCVQQCAAGAPDTRDIREIIYSPDGKTVKRWDRLGKRSTGDSSHLWHTHFSFFRDSTKAGRDQTPLFRRYLTSIGLIPAAQPLEDDMPTPADVWSADVIPAARPPYNNSDYGDPAKPKEGNKSWTAGYALQAAVEASRAASAEARAARLGQEAILAAVQGLDTAAILARIDQVAAAEQQRDEQLAELVRAGLGGELAADEVVRRIGELLTAAGPAQG